MSGARQQFLEDYQKIRMAEGRGSDSSEYYRALPFRSEWQWQMRSRTYEYFVRNLLPEKASDILDLGAGNGWLSYRLQERGHRPVAVDIFSDSRDGLRAARHYPSRFSTVEADFDALPFRNGSFDLAVFNASIHYSSDYARTLRETRRCLRPGGRAVILDSPIYAEREHGERMKQERQTQFEQQYGFRSEALGSIEYFDLSTLRKLEASLGIRWEYRKPWYGWRWHWRPVEARLKGERPPSRFWILVAKFA